MSCDICQGFTFLLPSCVKGQSLQMGLWNGWVSQQLCWPTALPCWSTQRGKWLELRWVLRGARGGGAPPRGSSAGRPHLCIPVGWMGLLWGRTGQHLLLKPQFPP